MTWVWHEIMKWGKSRILNYTSLGGVVDMPQVAAKQVNKYTLKRRWKNNPPKKIRRIYDNPPKPVLFLLVNLGSPNPNNPYDHKKGINKNKNNFFEQPVLLCAVFWVKPLPNQRCCLPNSLQHDPQPLPGHVRHLHPRHASVRPQARNIWDHPRTCKWLISTVSKSPK